MTTAERVEHIEAMMNRVLALEERLLEIVGDTKRDVVDQQAIIEHHEAMMRQMLALEERSMEIHADTSRPTLLK